jgi:hypothetical protein
MKKSELRQMIKEELLNEATFKQGQEYEVYNATNGEWHQDAKYLGKDYTTNGYMFLSDFGDGGYFVLIPRGKVKKYVKE